MMKERQSQVVLLLLIMLAVLVKSDDGISGSVSSHNITYGCFGAHCLATDIVEEADLFITNQRTRGRILATRTQGTAFRSNNQNSPVCPQSTVNPYSESCVGGPKPKCHGDVHLRAPYGCAP
ncbi:hypothetical protein S83_013757 [Arachis hypogaea]|nr:uncharacterized protein DS421_14g480430 [Arachis hypogaea]